MSRKGIPDFSFKLWHVLGFMCRSLHWKGKRLVPSDLHTPRFEVTVQMRGRLPAVYRPIEFTN